MYGPGVVNDRAIFTLRFVETQLSGHWLVLSIEAILYSSFIYVAAKEGKREIFLSLLEREIFLSLFFFCFKEVG